MKTTRRDVHGLAIAACLLVVGCSPDDSGGPPSYYQDVKPIVAARCAGCHQAGEIGPFSLTNYEEVAAMSAAVSAAVQDGSMPPWGAAPEHRDYRFDPTLSEAQIATIVAWAQAGAPAGDPAKEGPALPGVEQTLSRIDLQLKMPEAFTPSLSPDEYRCFLLDWPETETVFVTGFSARPGNPAIDHHISAFLVTPDNPLGQTAFDSLADLDAAEEGPGYTCFGGPAGDSGVQIPAQQIGQWVPGQGGGDFPPGTGIEVPPGSQVVLQVHYFTPPDNQASDLTVLEFSLATSVTQRAAFAPWLDLAWVFGDMPIPAGDDGVVHKTTGDPRGLFSSLVGNVDLSEGFVVHAAMIHMHRLGKRGEVRIERANGEREMLLDIPAYDFNWQRLYQLSEPTMFKNGDELTLRCEWDNSAANQPNVAMLPEDRNWGEGTDDEMCVGNLLISEP